MALRPYFPSSSYVVLQPELRWFHPMTVQGMQACFTELGERERLIAKRPIQGGMHCDEAFGLHGHISRAPTQTSGSGCIEDWWTPKTDQSFKAAPSAGLPADVESWRAKGVPFRGRDTDEQGQPLAEK